MNIIFCTPELTMTDTVEAGVFFQECRAILESYMTNVQYISRPVHIRQLLAQEADRDDILVFFISEKDEYDESLIKLLRKYSDAECRVWSIAMKAEYRMPPEPVVKKQSYDIPSRMENRNPLKNNMRAIAQLFARKIIAQTLSPLYRDEVLYFLSHRRSDGGAYRKAALGRAESSDAGEECVQRCGQRRCRGRCAVGYRQESGTE